MRVTTLRYNGTIHDFVILNPLSNTPAVRAAIRQATDALRSSSVLVVLVLIIGFGLYRLLRH